MKLTIRRATPQDAGAIARLGRELMKFEAKIDKLIRPISVLGLKRYYLKAIRSKSSAIFIALEGAKIVGFAYGNIEKRPSFYKIKSWGYYEDCYILPAYRHKGLTRRLTSELLKWFKAKGMRYAIVDTYARNAPAVATWRKLGFKDRAIYFEKKL